MTLEPPMEQVQESVHHQAEHSGDRWSTMVALSTAILAVMAAIAALLAEHYAHESLHRHMEAIDKWAQGQAKNEKSAIYSGTVAVLEAVGKPVPADLTKKIADEDKKKVQFYAEGDKFESDNKDLYARHEFLAFGVTLFQVAVAVSAIAVLTKRRWFWYMSLMFAVCALVVMAYALTFTPDVDKEKRGAEKKAPTVEKKSPGAEKTSPDTENKPESPESLWHPLAIQGVCQGECQRPAVGAAITDYSLRINA